MAVQLVAGDRRSTSKFSALGCEIFLLVRSAAYYRLRSACRTRRSSFPVPLAPWLAYGVAVTFLSTAVSAFVVALRSSLPFAIAGPDTSTSAVTAGLAASLVGQLIASGTVPHLLEPTLIVMAIGSALAGITLCGLGIARAGRATRSCRTP